MRYLAIDTSGAHLIVIAKNNDKEAVSYIKDCKLNHSVILMTEIDKAVKEIELDLKEVDFFACVLGAGSFTGIRIGISTIKAFAYAFNKQTLGLTAFDTLAYNYNKGKILAVIDAKHENYYVSGYEDKKIILEPSFIDKNILKQLALEYKLISKDFLEGLETEKVDLVNGFKKAIEENYNNLKDKEMLFPLYIRKSQAEENR